MSCILEHLTPTWKPITPSSQRKTLNVEALGWAPGAQCAGAFICFPLLSGLCLKTRSSNDSLTNMQMSEAGKVYF